MAKISLNGASPAVASLIHRLSVTSTETPVTDRGFHSYMLQLGFSSLRYYDIAQATAGDSMILVLSAAAGARNPETWIGTKLKFEDTTIGQSPDHSRPAIGSAILSAPILPNQRSWIEKFALAGHSWIDIPLVSDNELIGIIALDWEGQPSEINASGQLLLELIGSRTARGCEVYISRIISKLRSKIELLYEKHNIDERDFAISVSELIMTDFSNSAVSIF